MDVLSPPFNASIPLHKTVPIPISEASTSTIAWWSLGSGKVNTGAVVNVSFKIWNTSSACLDQTECLGRGEYMQWRGNSTEILNEFSIKVSKPQKSLQLFSDGGSGPISDCCDLLRVHADTVSDDEPEEWNSHFSALQVILPESL